MKSEVVHPFLEIVSQSGDPEVAEVFVARTRLGDDATMIEFVDGLDVRYPREDKWIINVSTQYGCPVSCRFCDAAHRYHGDVSAENMLAQVEAVMGRHPGLAPRCGKLKIHFARMGEPALNDEVLTALRRLPLVTRAPGLWACVATTAPRGRESWFESLLAVKNERYPGRFQLQFSLNSTDEVARAAITPIRLLPFDWIRTYVARFCGPKDRKVTLNFAMARGIPFAAQSIAAIFDPHTVCVKLTPLNPTREGLEHGLDSLNAEELEARAKEVEDAGFETIVSVGDGREDAIGSNCGQSVRRVREATARES